MNPKFKILLIALSISTLLMLFKFLAYFLTKSDAILTDALESIVNVIAGSFALFSIYQASRPKDITHPYGHGKVEFLSAGLEGILIIIAGVLMGSKAIYALFYPHFIDNLAIGFGLTLLLRLSIIL